MNNKTHRLIAADLFRMWKEASPQYRAELVAFSKKNHPTGLWVEFKKLLPES